MSCVEREIEDLDRESDPLDFAANLTAKLAEEGLQEVQRRLLPQKHEGFDGLHCVEEDCGEELPTQRLLDGRVRCTACQAIIEGRKRRGTL